MLLPGFSVAGWSGWRGQRRLPMYVPVFSHAVRPLPACRAPARRRPPAVCGGLGPMGPTGPLDPIGFCCRGGRVLGANIDLFVIPTKIQSPTLTWMSIRLRAEELPKLKYEITSGVCQQTPPNYIKNIN